MLQAIVCKYHGPTDTKGSRIVATCDAGRITVGIDNAKSVAENAADAARTLADKFGWRNRLVGGALPGDGYVFVLVSD